MQNLTNYLHENVIKCLTEKGLRRTKNNILVLEHFWLNPDHGLSEANKVLKLTDSSFYDVIRRFRLSNVRY